jgi:hypothetical protein
VGLGKVRDVPGRAHQRAADHAVARLDLGDRLEQPLERRERVFGLRGGLGLLLEPAQPLDRDRREQVLLGRERAVDGRLAHAGRVCDRVHPRVEPVLGEHRRRGLDDPFAVAQRVRAGHRATTTGTCARDRAGIAAATTVAASAIAAEVRNAVV